VGLAKFAGRDLSDRYLNAMATFAGSLENGTLDVRIHALEVKGKAVPESAMTKIRAKNFAEEAQKDPDTVRFLRKLDRIEVRDSSVIITPKPPGER
jgi:hypothetical protein